MNKEFKIGDKIKFIRSNDFGVIKEIISERKVKVEDSSNFIVQVNKDEIILQDDSTNSVSSYGDLSKIKECVKLTGFVNSTDDFTDQPKVINGASDIIAKILHKNQTCVFYIILMIQTYDKVSGTRIIFLR